MHENVEQHLIERFARATMQTWPFAHCFIEEAFPAAFYPRLLQRLPPPEAMHPIAAVRTVGARNPDQRFILPLEPPRIEALAEPYRSFWSETSGALLGKALRDCVLDRFRPYAGEYFDRLGEHRLRHEAFLCDDRTRLYLGPHTDVPTKAVSLVFYLPADDSRSHLGTSLYVPKDESFTSDGRQHLDFARFERVRTMPYRPNTLFAFARTDRSFHGVEPITDPDCRRHVLLYDIRVPAGA